MRCCHSSRSQVTTTHLNATRLLRQCATPATKRGSSLRAVNSYGGGQLHPTQRHHTTMQHRCSTSSMGYQPPQQPPPTWHSDAAAQPAASASHSRATTRNHHSPLYKAGGPSLTTHIPTHENSQHRSNPPRRPPTDASPEGDTRHLTTRPSTASYATSNRSQLRQASPLPPPARTTHTQRRHKTTTSCHPET